MKKHLQFNDITALSLGWRAARRKAEKERRAEREKEQSSSSLLCIFIKENITSSPLVLPFSSPLLAFLSHSFTFPPLSWLSVLCSLSPFFLYHHWLIFLFSPLCLLIHLFGPFSFALWDAVYPTMYLFSVLYCHCYGSQSTGLSEGLERFISKHYKSALSPSCLLPAPWYLSFYFTSIAVFSFTPRHRSTLMSNHWSSLSLPCTWMPQSSKTFTLKLESLSWTPSWVQTGSGNRPWVRTVFSLTGTGWTGVNAYPRATLVPDATFPVKHPARVATGLCLCLSLWWCAWMHVCLWGYMIQTTW